MRAGNAGDAESLPAIAAAVDSRAARRRAPGPCPCRNGRHRRRGRCAGDAACHSSQAAELGRGRAVRPLAAGHRAPQDDRCACAAAAAASVFRSTIFPKSWRMAEHEPDMLVADVDRHLDSLPPGQRKVVRAIAVDGASIGEAAARFSMSNGAVRVALHRGLAALARKFQERRSHEDGRSHPRPCRR